MDKNTSTNNGQNELNLFTVAGCCPSQGATYEYRGPESQLIALINSERQAIDIPPIAVNWEVSRLARYKSEEMKTHQMFTHESLLYGDPAELLTRFNVPFAKIGANIAMGQETPQEVLESWLSSPGHMANIVNPSFTSAGVGYSCDDNGISFWTLILVAKPTPGPTAH